MTYEVPIIELNEDLCSNIFVFGVAPYDPISIATEESKFLLRRERVKKDPSETVRVTFHKKYRTGIKYHFERKIGYSKFKYWAFPKLRDEFDAVNIYLKIDPCLVEKESGEEEDIIEMIRVLEP